MTRPLQPASRLGWWAFWLGCATLFWGRLFLALPALVGPLLNGAGSRPMRIPLGLAGAAIEVLLTISALVVGGIALKKGERSWFGLVAFALAFFVGGFWVVFALGEVLAPH